jgi:hypothetical protein
MKSADVDRIAAVAERLAPQSPGYRYRRLFSERDFDLYEKQGNYEEEGNELKERRQRAVTEISIVGGVQAVLEFASAVESPWRVGVAFGIVADHDADLSILPKLLENAEKSLAQFAEGFVWGRFRSRGWDWLDEINMSHWTPAQRGQLLAYLPFAPDTWMRATRFLGADESPYWTKTNANPYDTGTGLEVAVDRLIDHGRPQAAIRCLHKMLYDKQPFDSARTARALLGALGSSEPVHANDSHEISQIIKALQDDPGTNLDDQFKVEWAYLPLLDQREGRSPKLLERRLAEEPRFFCEVIRLVYLAKNDERVEPPTEEVSRIATNAYRLLNHWRTPPGSLGDRYDSNALVVWLDQVKTECTKTGHLEIAMTIVGKALVYAPEDPDGLWIHRAAAAALNAKDAEAMRDGFRTELFNSRGGFYFTAGRAEQELSAHYRTRADILEANGFYRFARALRDLATSYQRDAERDSSRDPFDD